MKRIDKFVYMIKRHIIILLLVLGVLFVGVGFMTNIFAQLQPVKSIEIFSEKLDYNHKKSGSWKIKKSAKWIEKNIVEVTYDVDSVIKKKSPNLDVLLVLDVSSSMEGRRISKLKFDSITLINSLLSDEGNTVGLITFDSSSEIVSDFTDNKSELNNKISSLRVQGSTNYYRALLNVESVLKNYTSSADRKCIVLFLTDGYPNEETPNENGQYGYLKSLYPFITVNGVQYEMGDTVLEQLKKITDNQFIANMDTLSNTLFDATLNSIEYDNFVMEDFFDIDYFSLEKDSINVSSGSFNYDSDTNKLSWNIDKYYSGTDEKMTIKLKLKDGVENGIYPLSDHTVVNSKLGEDLEEVNSTDTPVLANNFKVIYDGNAPDECSFDNVPEDKYYNIFDTVNISDNALKCDGYQFKGWHVINKDVDTTNKDYFKMIDENVIIRAEWSKLGIRKSTEGKIKENLTLYKQVESDFNDSSKFVKKYTGNTSTFKGKEDIYYYYGAAKNNNVVFANYCWKIVRTTDTGGVKLIYNGVPAADGSCNNIGDDAVLTGEQMNRSKNTVPFNKFNNGSLTDIGYMYNADARYVNAAIKPIQSVIGAAGMDITDNFNYYYADSYNYEDGKYILSDSTQYSWIDNFQELVGKYTCRSTYSNGTCANLSYVIRAYENTMYYIKLSDGNGIDDIGYEITFTLSNEIVDNMDGTFSLVNPITVKKSDWITEYSKYKKYYTCLSNETTCDNMKYIITPGNISFGYFDVATYKYGNSFEYNGKNYVLKDTIDTYSPYVENTLNNNHYTCFNSSGVCEKVYYIYALSDEKGILYITLENGKSIEDALDDMLYGSAANNDSSMVKVAIDYWYQNYMTDYTDYLEDTVWCADRSMTNKDENGWNPNGGSTSSYLTFGYYNKSDDLTCPNLNDRFTVSNENGNGALTYPVGMLTFQEQKLAFDSKSSPKSPFGLVENKNRYWLITPQDYRNDCMRSMTLNADSIRGECCMGSEATQGYFFGARPTISLREGTIYMSGDGSVKMPYVIDLSVNS